MNILFQNPGSTKTNFSNLVLWAIFILYVIILSIALNYHELWGDEIHSWNIAKASGSLSELISNARYEGHPPVWYIILWLISKFTHNVYYIQPAQLIIACIIIFLLLFLSPLPFITKLLIPFGYFFLFEYGVLSRNYAIGVLFAFCICIILHKNFKYKFLLYYALLFLLSNTHLIALVLACSLHVYFLLQKVEQKNKRSTITVHTLVGIIMVLPSIYFIFPPSDSGLNTQFILSRWSMSQITALIQLPLRSFIPVPAWWNYNFWNTQFLLELQGKYHIVRIATAITVFGLFFLLFLILRKNRKSLMVFSFHLFLSFIVSLIFSLTTARYSGFIFIGFIVAYWLYCNETTAGRNNKLLVTILLSIQVFAGLFAVIKDIQLPFSNGYKVQELLDEVPPAKKTVTDYWALNTLVAFTDKPFYCLELYKEKSFLQWDSELAVMIKAPAPYSKGAAYFFQKEGIKEAYMISIHAPQKILHSDPQLAKSFRFKLVDKREGAIEKGSNLYLYLISAN